MIRDSRVYQLDSGDLSMKRSLVSVLFAGTVIGALGVCGCGGGGMDEGMPKDMTPGVPTNSIKADMAVPGAKKPGLPSGEAPKPGTPTP
jgi:hypothetical protein